MDTTSAIPDDVVFLRIDGDGNLQPTIIAANIVTLAGAIIIIVLRFLSRRMSKTKYSWDDWLVFPALLFAIIYFGNMCGTLSYGFGKYIGGVSFARLRQAFIGIFVGELTYAFSITFTKFSILALYNRLFDQGWARTYCYVLAGINAAWIVAAIILSCLQCQPTRGFWDRNIGATCNLNVRATFLGLGIITILTDVALVALPTYICWHLSLNNTKRILICCVFVTGLFVTVASGIRLKAILSMDTGMDLKALNVTWTFSDTALWSGVEANMAIVSSCLPVLRPLIAKAVPTSIVPVKLRKPSQPTSYYGLSSKSRKPSAAAATPLDNKPLKSHVDVEAQRETPDQTSTSGVGNLTSEEAPLEAHANMPTRPPTPPPKDVEPVMKATLTRPPSWNTDFTFTDIGSPRLNVGSSDSLNPRQSSLDA